MAMLTSKVFGFPDIANNQTPSTFPTRKTLALLIYLLVEGGLHSREHLIELFWPESSGRDGRTVLRQVLRFLRKALEPHADLYLIVQGDLIGINANAPLDSDLLALSALWHELSQIPALDDLSPDTAQTLADRLETTVSLYRGEFLDGFSIGNTPSFDTWIDFHRTQWQQRINALFKALVTLHINTNQMAKALDSVYRWLDKCPTSEAAYLMLIKLQAAMGNYTAALATYDTCRNMLSTQFDLPPSPELEALIWQIKQSKPSNQGKHGKPSSRSSIKAARVLPPLRAEHAETPAGLPDQDHLAEYTTLIRGYQALPNKGLQAVYLYGPRGVGKTRLVLEFLRWARIQGADIVQGQAFEPHAQIPFHPWIHALRARIEAENAPDDLLSDTWLSEIATLLPELYDRYPDLPITQKTSSNAGDPRLFEAITRLGIALAEHTPLILVLDDLQWADQPSLDLLHYVIYRWQSIAASILVILSQTAERPDDLVVKWTDQLIRLNCLTLLHLRSLAQTITATTTNSVPVTPVRPMLPAQTTTFVGRITEQAHLRSWLADSQIRLITILGAGGMGKTRLALEVASTQAINFADGVIFVALAPLTSPDAIMSAIAEATRFQFYPGANAQQQFLDYLREKQMLILLDNVEHLLAGITVVSDILQAAPRLKILATSRERLNLEGEMLFRLEGMDFLDWASTHEALNADVVKLFLQSTRRLQPSFTVTEANLPDVAYICRQVEGMPLGILLAAAWIEVLSISEIASEIAHGIDFLATQQRDIPARHHSLRAVFDHSWKLCGVADQAVFKKLTVFRGSFTRHAAEHIAQASLPSLMTLVNKSMLRRDPMNGRYEIHELLRLYAAQTTDARTADTNEGDDAQLLHCRYYAEFVAQRHLRLYSADELQVIAEFDAERANLEAAWLYAATHRCEHELRLMTLDLLCYVELRGIDSQALFRQGVDWLEHNPVSNTDDLSLGLALMALGNSNYLTGISDLTLYLLQRCLPILRRYDCQREVANTLYRLAVATGASPKPSQKTALLMIEESVGLFRLLDNAAETSLALLLLAEWSGVPGIAFEKTLAIVEEAMRYARQSGAPAVMLRVLLRTGIIKRQSGDYVGAQAALQAALNISASLDSPFFNAFIWHEFGNIALCELNLLSAQQHFEQAVQLFRHVGRKQRMMGTINNLALVAYLQGNYSEAYRYLIQVIAFDREVKNAYLMTRTLINLVFPTAALGYLGEAEAYWREALTHVASDIGVFQNKLEVLMAYADLLDRTNQSIHAAEVLAAVLAQTALPTDGRLMADPILERLTANLPADALAEAQQRGQTLDIEILFAEANTSPPFFT